MQAFGGNVAMWVKHKCDSLAPRCICHLSYGPMQGTIRAVAVVHTDWVLDVASALWVGQQEDFACRNERQSVSVRMLLVSVGVALT